MTRQADITAMAAKAFADHAVTREAGNCWRLGKPRSSIYAFRIAWMPGALVITGDLGEAIWRGPTDFWASPWEAARFVATCSADYLFGKSTLTTIFDADATVQAVLRAADDQMRHGDRDIWRRICRRYGLDADRVTDHMKAAAILREEGIGRPGDAFDLTGDFELDVYAMPPTAQWHYEALQLWARHMIEAEPFASHIARARRRLRSWLRGWKHYPAVWRPILMKRRRDWNPSNRYYQHASGSFRLLTPIRVAGHDLSRFGLWREQGSSSPPRAAGDFEPVGED